MPSMDPLVRAERARQLLDDPLLKEAFALVESDLIRKQKSASLDDVTAHHIIGMSLALLGSVRAQFEKMMADGEIEQSRRKERGALSLFRR